MTLRPTLAFAATLVVILLGTASVLAAPRYQVDAPQPTPSSLFVIEQPPTPEPTPIPGAAPTPASVAAPALTPPPSGVVTFPVPVYRQVMNLDCETAALQMGLAALGQSYSQQQLFAGENPDTRAPVMGPFKKVIQWGDPYTNFVGNVNGSDLGPTGYGVYYPLILAIARSHGAAGSTGGEGLTAAAIYAALAAGHPVVAWVETGWENARAAGYTGVWTAWDGKPIRYSLIEHAVTLSGVSATQVRVNDPWKSGSQYWFSKIEFERSWADFNNMAVVLQ